MVAAMIQPRPKAMAAQRIAAATLRSWTTWRQTSNGAILASAPHAPAKRPIPRQAKMTAFNTGTSVMFARIEYDSDERGWPSGRASAFQADLHGFESRTPLHTFVTSA